MYSYISPGQQRRISNDSHSCGRDFLHGPASTENADDAESLRRDLEAVVKSEAAGRAPPDPRGQQVGERAFLHLLQRQRSRGDAQVLYKTALLNL
jgi:hypothetical protein